MTRPSSWFLSQLAHDLRSPLNVIGSTLAELGQDDKLTAADRLQVVTLCQRAVRRLILLSDRLSMAARLEQPIETALAPVDLAKLTRDTLEQFVATQLRRRIQVVSAFPESQVKVHADASLVAMLLLELLTNANRYARQLVRVELKVAESATVTIDDDGEGFKEDPAALFEPFAERTSRTGLGMGLWIAKSLAVANHGTLTIERLSVGTRQQLTFPIQK